MSCEIVVPSSSESVNIIGISCGYHDSACCLLQDGRLVAAAQEERFSRIKNDKSLPKQAFRYCLQAGGLALSDITCIAYYEDPTLKLGRQIWMALQDDITPDRRMKILDCMVRLPPETIIRRSFGYQGRIECTDHHLSHAASAYYYSGFPDAAILTIDGVGEWSTTTYGCGRDHEIGRFEAVDFPHSLGLYYSAITAYLGFEVNEGEYKVMGLAPYGRPLFVDRIRKLVEVGPKGSYTLDLDYFAFLREDRMYSDQLQELLGAAPRSPESEITQFHMDVARSAQVVLEEILLEKVLYLHSRIPSENLCLAGGVALNVVANTRCLRDGPFRRLFVQPAAGDAGGALGAAAIAHVRMTGARPCGGRLRHVYLGPHSPPGAAADMLESSSAQYRDFRGDELGLIRYTVERLIEGKTVGWYQGRMEFGPRALGARSILADPRNPDMRDRINRLVKMRETFRPFAPAVLESEARDYFDLDHPSPFMLEICQVTCRQALPAITHVDGSSRPQTVSRDTNPRFTSLIEEFWRRTGCPMLLNTSFNMRGEPIVCSPLDAVNCFVRSGLETLVLEDFVVERAGIPPLWEVQAQRSDTRNPAASVGHVIYTMF
jgi:carbamoyltransferase